MMRRSAAAMVGLVLVGSICSAQQNSRAGSSPKPHDQRGMEAMASLGAELVPATTADPSIKTEFDDPSVVATPQGTPRKELVVLLPGTGGKPAQYSLLIKTLAANGFRVIGLMYNDKPTEADACGRNTNDIHCHRNFHEERFAGDAPGATRQNTAKEGIDHRLETLLQYLDKEHPGAGWGEYVRGDELVWKKIIITGHSQGSGHAAYIAKTHEVARAVLFSGPYDGNDMQTATPKPAEWLSDVSKTPADRWYAEYHEKDLGATLPPMTLAALKVPADHILVSHLEPTQTSVNAYHSVGTHDPRMAPQWKWLFGIEGGVR